MTENSTHSDGTQRQWVQRKYDEAKDRHNEAVESGDYRSAKFWLGRMGAFQELLELNTRDKSSNQN